MPAPANLIRETSTSTGTGNLTLAAVNGHVRFSNATYGFGTGGTDKFWYFISSRTAAEWEIGTGHMSDANTLVRDTVLFSSNSNAAVNFSAGIKDISNDVPAEHQVRYEGAAVTDGHGVLFDGITGLALKTLGAVPISAIGMQVFTSTGGYTPTTGTKRILVIITGGGGGACRSSDSNGVAGGGAGATCFKMLDATSETVTIGAGGAGRTTSAGVGTNGGDSTFGSHCTAGGGQGSSNTVVSGMGGALGGTATGGDLNIAGGDSGGAASQDGDAGSNGGASFWGSGGAGRDAQAGVNARAYGSGGGGGGQNDNGGNGADGVALILEFG